MKKIGQFIAKTAEELGLSTGKEFKYSEPWHFYQEVPWGKEKRPEYIKLVRWEHAWIQLKSWIIKSHQSPDPARNR